MFLFFRSYLYVLHVVAVWVSSIHKLHVLLSFSPSPSYLGGICEVLIASLILIESFLFFLFLLFSFFLSPSCGDGCVGFLVASSHQVLILLVFLLTLSQLPTSESGSCVDLINSCSSSATSCPLLFPTSFSYFLSFAYFLRQKLCGRNLYLSGTSCLRLLRLVFFIFLLLYLSSFLSFALLR